MSDTKLELESPRNAATEKALAAHKKNVTTYLTGVRRSGAQLYGYMYLVGREINRAKEVLEHGELTKWVLDTFNLPQQTQNRWRQLAEEIDAKLPTVGVLKGKGLLLSPKKNFSKQEVETILKVIPEVMEGKNPTDFLRDCKLVKEPQAPTYHPPKQVSAEEKLAAEKQAAKDSWAAVIADMTMFDKQLSYLDKVEAKALATANVSVLTKTADLLDKAGRKELLDQLVQVNDKLRASLKLEEK
jgi:hypothetical protein